MFGEDRRVNGGLQWGPQEEKRFGDGGMEKKVRHLGGWYCEFSQVLYSMSRGGMGSGEVTSQVSPVIRVMHLLPPWLSLQREVGTEVQGRESHLFYLRTDQP